MNLGQSCRPDSCLLFPLSRGEGWGGEGKQKGMRGHALTIANMPLNKTALPNSYPRPTDILLPGSLRLSCPSRCRPVFDPSNRVFLNSVTACACFGREKGVCDKLQRHPLIDPIFGPHPSPERRGEVLSAPFARGNLHLVIPPQAGPSR